MSVDKRKRLDAMVNSGLHALTKDIDGMGNFSGYAYLQG